MLFTLADQYVWKEIGQQVVVLHFDTGAYWTLNDTGSLVWKCVLEGLPVGDIVARVCEEFSVEEGAAEVDVQEFLKTCVDKNMLLAA